MLSISLIRPLDWHLSVDFASYRSFFHVSIFSCALFSVVISPWSKFFSARMRNKKAIIKSIYYFEETFVSSPFGTYGDLMSKMKHSTAQVKHFSLTNLFLTSINISLKPGTESCGLRFISSSIVFNHTDCLVVFFHGFNGSGFNATLRVANPLCYNNSFKWLSIEGSVCSLYILVLIHENRCLI